MAHQLTVRANGFAEIAWSGDTPWHGLGQKLPEDADMNTWRTAAGLDFQIERKTVNYFDDNGDAHQFKGQNVLYRSDNNEPMSVVSDRYKIVQPEQVLDFFKKLAETQGFKLHTAGSLKGGKRIWALAETGQVADVLKDDSIARYVLLATSYDKGMATTARETNIRVVCANTLAMAEHDSQNVVSIPHSTDFLAESVHRQLGFTKASFELFIEQAKFLASKQVNANSFNHFMSHLIGKQQFADENNEDLTKNRAYKKILELFDGGAIGSDITGIRGTRWQLLNAVTEYVDHHSPNRSPDARLDSAWFRQGSNLKTDALQIVTSVM
jgi:phage/plasmid-like protein (TIGR03299 family)